MVIEEAHTPGRFAQLMADRAQVVEAMTILPEFPTTVGNVKQGEYSQLAIGATASVQEEGGGTPQQIKRHSLH